MKVLLVSRSLKVGGIERALVEQVNYMVNQNIKVDLLLFAKNGAYLDDVDNRVRIIGNLPLFKYISLTQTEARKQGWFAYLLRSIFAALVKVIHFPLFWRVSKCILNQVGDYDFAISYVHNGNLNSLYCGCNEYVLDKVKAKKKIAWIHSDYLFGKISNHYNDSMYKRFDAVVNVSHSMKDKFDSLCIVPKEKSFIVYNRFSQQTIVYKANQDRITLSSDCFNIVTVGRLEKEKGVDKLFHVALELAHMGIRFRWIFIGTGILKQWCSDFVVKHKLESFIILLGQIPNPYPYVKAADLYVSGSLSETFGLSILEALVLGTATLAYKFDAIYEVLTDNNGCVVSTFEEMVDKLAAIISSPKQFSVLQSKAGMLTDYNQLSNNQLFNLFKSLNNY